MSPVSFHLGSVEGFVLQVVNRANSAGNLFGLDQNLPPGGAQVRFSADAPAKGSAASIASSHSSGHSINRSASSAHLSMNAYLTRFVVARLLPVSDR